MSHIIEDIKQLPQYLKRAIIAKFHEIETEFREEVVNFDTASIVAYARANWHRFIFLPYVPSFSKPGWLLRYYPASKLYFWSNNKIRLFSDTSWDLTTSHYLIPCTTICSLVLRLHSRLFPRCV